MAAAQKATVAWEASNDGTSATPMEKAYLKLAVDGGMDGGTWKRCMQDETHSPPGLPDQGEDESWRLLDQLPKPHRPTSDDTQDVDETQLKKTRTCPFPGCGKAVKFQYNGTTTEGWERCVASDNIRKHCIGSDHIRFFFAFGRMETRKPSLYYVVQKLLYDSHKGHEFPTRPLPTTSRVVQTVLKLNWSLSRLVHLEWRKTRRSRTPCSTCG